MTSAQPQQSDTPVGTRDGQGAGDNDQPYRFGLRPRANAPYPFNTRQFARLLMLRGRIQDHVGTSQELTDCADRPCDLRTVK